jgi:hypothetical protein
METSYLYNTAVIIGVKKILKTHEGMLFKTGKMLDANLKHTAAVRAFYEKFERETDQLNQLKEKKGKSKAFLKEKKSLLVRLQKTIKLHRSHCNKSQKESALLFKTHDKAFRGLKSGMKKLTAEKDNRKASVEIITELEKFFVEIRKPFELHLKVVYSNIDKDKEILTELKKQYSDIMPLKPKRVK